MGGIFNFLQISCYFKEYILWVETKSCNLKTLNHEIFKRFTDVIQRRPSNTKSVWISYNNRKFILHLIYNVLNISFFFND